MTREIYSEKVKTTELTVTNNQITAIQKSDTTKTGLRLYDGGFIGVAGAIGAYDEKKLNDRAKQMLNFKIPYDCESAKNVTRTEDLTGSFDLSEVDFVNTSESLLERLSKHYPQFAFSHKITYKETENSLCNDSGVNLKHRDKHVMVQLLYKYKDSLSMMDGFTASISRCYDLDDVFRLASETLECYNEKITLPEEKLPVLFLMDPQTVLTKFYTDLNGRMMGTGASLFAGKIGQKLFADDFSLCVKRNPLKDYQCFFDAEGTVLPGDSFPLIKNGVLKSAYAGKKVAKQFGYAATGSAEGEYDSVPDGSPMSIGINSGGKTIQELLGGRKAILSVFASGGDFTPQGEFATPMQAAYVFDGERLLGRLPQIVVRSSIYDMFGKDFIGVSTDGNSPHTPFRYLALDMDASVIGEWM